MPFVPDPPPIVATVGASASAWLVVVAVAAGSSAVAWLLRTVRVPGERVLAGIVVGVVVGPTVLGRVAPEPWERMVMGGSAERAVLEARRSELKAWQLARSHIGAGTDGTTAAEYDAQTAAIAEAETAWHQAVAEHQRPLRIAILLLAGVVGGSVAFGRSGGRGASWSAAISIGLWSAGLPVSIGLVVLWLRREPLLGPASLAAMAALAVGSWGLNRADRRAARRTGREGPALSSGASGVATAIAATLLLTSLLRSSVLDGGSGYWLCLGSASAAGLAGLVVVRRSVRAFGPTVEEPRLEEPRPPHPLARMVEGAAIPTVTGLVALQADWIADFSFWIVVGAAIASGDGRWTGAWVGAMLSGGRRPRDAARLALGACGSGPLQVTMAAIAVCGGLLPRDWTVAVLLGAAATDLTASVRRRFAQIVE